MGEELRELIRQVDDDYLTGLGNKGILKRAYKDLEQESPVADWQQEEARDKAQEKMRTVVQVKLNEETCMIRAPLGDSTCTCPSRSMCRHIVTAVLWLKGSLDDGGGQETKAAEEAGRTEEQGKAQEAVKTVEPEEAGGPEEAGDPAKPKFAEFLALPQERLIKACGPGHYRKLVARVRAGGLPPVEAGSIVTVELPWERAVVRLLEPLSYSSCTCHSKELCTHKAQALLIWRLREGVCTLQELEAGQDAEGVLDQGQMREVCESLREAVKLQLCTGLSRQSPEVSVSMERLAVISHRAGLADMERSLRGAAEEYTQYFERQARFREEELLDRLLGLYRLAGQIQETGNTAKLQRLAGNFRDAYEYAGTLRLIGMGSRAFKSKAGYEGEIYYFLNEADGRYLTWTDARPTFYEGTERKRNAQEYSQTPWGLECSRRQLFEMEIELVDARLAPGGRLSASQETRGELLGAKRLLDDEVCGRIIWDYRRLLELMYSPRTYGAGSDASGEAEAGAAAFDDGAGGRKGERLALLGAVRWGEAVFDKTRQRFSWELFDTQGRRIYVSLRYTREERLVIQLLERMEKKVRKGKYASLVLFGSLYLQEGRLCLYPVEFWLQKTDGLLSACGQKTFLGPEASAEADKEALPEPGAADKEALPESEAAAGSAASPGKAPPLPSREALDIMEQYLREIGRNLADLFVSGLRSSSEELEGRISACAAEGEELGLHYAGEKLAEIAELLRGRHHRMEFTPEPLLEVWEELQLYLKTCNERVSFDRVRLSLEADKEEPAEVQ